MGVGERVSTGEQVGNSTLQRSVLMKEQKYLLNPAACDCSSRLVDAKAHSHTNTLQPIRRAAQTVSSTISLVNLPYIYIAHLLHNLAETAAFAFSKIRNMHYG